MVSVVVAEDNLLVREGLRALIDAQDGLEVVATCADYDSLMGAARRLVPDVVITDIRMPPHGSDEGIRAATELRRTHPEMGVIVLSQYVESGYAVALMEGGSDRRAYLLKERVFELPQLLAAIQQVTSGGSVVDSMVVDALLSRRRSDSPLGALSSRETETLAEIAQGRTNGAIAERLFISEKSVQKHINSIFAKLGLPEDGVSHRRVRAVLLYLDSR